MKKLRGRAPPESGNLAAKAVVQPGWSEKKRKNLWKFTVFRSLVATCTYWLGTLRAVHTLTRSMTGNAPKTPPPSEPIADAELSDERSCVREKVESGSRPPPQSAPQRLEVLLRRAKLLLSDMPADDARARLLKIAMMRRDETLLIRLLDEASSAVGVAPPRTPPDR